MKFISNKNNFSNNMIVDLHNETWLEKQRIAGKVVAQTLNLLKNLIKEKTTKTLKELDEIAETFILDNNCIPTFKNYKGFPNATCISVNKQLVHSIPNDYHLQEGDLVSFDLGATYENIYIADAARTFVFGNYKNEQHALLVKTTEECLQKAIDSIVVGKQLGVIGETIYKHARSKDFSVVDSFGGHSLSQKNGKGIPHASPFISNRDNSDNGIRFTNGMTLAIEPLLVIGSSNKTKIASNGWDVICENYCAHFEDTIFIHDNKVEILTR